MGAWLLKNLDAPIRASRRLCCGKTCRSEIFLGTSWVIKRKRTTLFLCVKFMDVEAEESAAR